MKNLIKQLIYFQISLKINFRYKEEIGLLPLYAMNVNGYKRIIELSSKSYLENDGILDPHCDFFDLNENNYEEQLKNYIEKN